MPMSAVKNKKKPQNELRKIKRLSCSCLNWMRLEFQRCRIGLQRNAHSSPEAQTARATTQEGWFLEHQSFWSECTAFYIQLSSGWLLCLEEGACFSSNCWSAAMFSLYRLALLQYCLTPVAEEVIYNRWICHCWGVPQVMVIFGNLS